MKKIALTLILSVMFLALNAQSIDIQGFLMDAKTQKPVQYANIGIAEKNIGTVTDENGRFVLAVPDSLTKHDLTFSRIGYQKKNVAVNSFGKHADTLLLVPEIYELQEVTVSVGKMRERKVGHAGNKMVQFQDNASHLGYEFGTMLKLSKKKPSLLKDFNFQAVTFGNIDYALMRVNIYQVDGEEFTNVLKENIYVTLTDNESEYEKCVNLLPYNIVVQGEIAVTLELVKVHYKAEPQKVEQETDGYGSDGIGYAGTFLNNMCGRDASQGAWEKISAVGPAFWLHVLQ
ncbi:MAG: carboxypeptidase-like regulatory domain-containing protein [bacterium]|nr:carboxypeptidase-like regulatory domain-containing protein [Candidatus Limimorpha equi]